MAKDGSLKTFLNDGCSSELSGYAGFKKNLSLLLLLIVNMANVKAFKQRRFQVETERSSVWRKAGLEIRIIKTHNPSD